MSRHSWKTTSASVGYRVSRCEKCGLIRRHENYEPTVYVMAKADDRRSWKKAPNCPPGHQ
jgi:hypothetical protein